MKSLDPQAQALLDAAAASGLPPVYRLPIPEARERMRRAFITGELDPIAKMANLTIAGPEGGLKVRLYHPSPDEQRPVVLFFHGGGWTVNDLDTHDRLCIALAHHSNCAVVSVDYRRGPETKYPGPVDDAYTAFTWVTQNGRTIGADTTRLTVAGDSSGGTLATVVAMLAKERGGPEIRQQVLFYPVTDYLDPPSGSYVERATGYSLDGEFMKWSWENYLPEHWSADDPYLFPLRATDLTGLPEAIVLTAEYDPLRDEGIAYVTRLKEAGVSVDHTHMEDQMHGFAMQTRTIERARMAVIDVARKIAAAQEKGAVQ